MVCTSFPSHQMFLVIPKFYVVAWACGRLSLFRCNCASLALSSAKDCAPSIRGCVNCLSSSSLTWAGLLPRRLSSKWENDNMSPPSVVTRVGGSSIGWFIELSELSRKPVYCVSGQIPHIWSHFDRSYSCIACFCVLSSRVSMDWQHGHKSFDIASRYVVTEFSR